MNYVAENDIGEILVGEYYLSNLILPEESHPVDTWGGLRHDCLKEHCPIQYTNLITASTLWIYCADMDEKNQE